MSSAASRLSKWPCIFALIAIGASACSPAPAVSAERDPVALDVEGYAVASCLAAQDSAYLKDQGDGWASNIVQRGSGDIEILTVLADVVREEAKKGTMPMARNEAAPMDSKPLPVQYCAEIIDTPRVRQAIGRTIEQLAPAYRKR